MARIGSVKTNDLITIGKAISKDFLDLLKKEESKARTEGKTLFPKEAFFTYTTIEHGQMETIQDINGKNYGLDHGSCASWGFTS